MKTVLLFILSLATGATALAAAPATAEGVLLPFKEVTLSAAAFGILAEVRVKEGDTVAANDMLARLIDRVEAAEVKRFAKVLEQKEFAAQGTSNLYLDKVVSEGEAIEKRIERDIAQLQHEIAQEQLARHHIRSPINGLVVEKKKEVGEAVDINEAVLRLVDISRVYLQVFIEATTALKLKHGQAGAVRFPEYSDVTWPGTIDFIDPRIDGASGLVRIKVLIDNPDRKLIAGMRGTVAFAP
jgi:RND family efflux transporter MFP subunit